MNSIKLDMTGLSISTVGKAIGLLLSEKPKGFRIKNALKNVDAIYLENIENLEEGQIPENVIIQTENDATRILAESSIKHEIEIVALAYGRDAAQKPIQESLFYDDNPPERITRLNAPEVVQLASRYDEYIDTAVDAGAKNGGIENEEFDNMAARRALASVFSSFSKANTKHFSIVNDKFDAAKADRDAKHKEIMAELSALKNKNTP